MSERGDVMIINEETGIRLAGQEVETPYGKLTLLVGDSFYQNMVQANFGRETDNGGYPDIVNNPYKDEIVRILSTLLALKEREVSLGRDFSSYQPTPKDLIIIYMKPGNTIWLADSMKEDLLDPNELRTISNYEVGYPTFEWETDKFMFIRFYGLDYQLPSDWEDKELEFYRGLNYMITNPFFQLIVEAAVSNGYDHIDFSNRYTNKGYEGIKQSPFSSLFTHPGIDAGMSNKQPLLLENVRMGIPSVIEIDFENFK